MKNRFYVILSIAVLSVTSLIGCGNKKSGGGSTETPTSESSVTEKFTVTFKNFDSLNKFLPLQSIIFVFPDEISNIVVLGTPESLDNLYTVVFFCNSKSPNVIITPTFNNSISVNRPFIKY